MTRKINEDTIQRIYQDFPSPRRFSEISGINTYTVGRALGGHPVSTAEEIERAAIDLNPRTALAMLCELRDKMDADETFSVTLRANELLQLLFILANNTRVIDARDPRTRAVIAGEQVRATAPQ